MRYKGKIITWNDDRGFGFIEPNGGSGKVFVHISSFSDRKQRPSIGNIITYEVIKDERGRYKAQNVVFPGSRSRKTVVNRTHSFPWSRVATVTLIAAVSIGVYFLYAAKAAFTDHGSFAHRAIAAKPTFHCEGKKHCSQMSSCEEAKFYLNNCPGTKMDGDRDGVPCESQWCSF